MPPFPAHARGKLARWKHQRGDGGCAKTEEEAFLRGPAKRRRRASSSVVGPVSLFPHLELNSHPRQIQQVPETPAVALEASHGNGLWGGKAPAVVHL